MHGSSGADQICSTGPSLLCLANLWVWLGFLLMKRRIPFFRLAHLSPLSLILSRSSWALLFLAYMDFIGESPGRRCHIDKMRTFFVSLPFHPPLSPSPFTPPFTHPFHPPLSPAPLTPCGRHSISRCFVLSLQAFSPLKLTNETVFGNVVVAEGALLFNWFPSNLFYTFNSESCILYLLCPNTVKTINSRFQKR